MPALRGCKKEASNEAARQSLRTMKICCFTDTFFPLVGGAEMVLHNLALNLADRGHEVRVLAPKIRKADNSVSAPYYVHRYPKPSSKRFLVRQTLVYLLWLYRRTHFEILHCHSAYPCGYVASALKALTGIPVVVRPHGSDVVPGGRIRKNPRLEKRLRGALIKSDAIIAQGEYLKETVVDLGVDENKVHIINNGVDLSSFSQGKPFPHVRPYILALGNLIPRKGFDILLQAYSLLENPEPDLLIAGPGGEEGALKSLAGNLGISERVRFLGYIEGQEKIDLFRSADFFVCPSRKEPFPNVILEALAAGLPVIASDIDGNRELVWHNWHGLLFSAEDVKALKDCLEAMIGNRALVERLRSAVPEFVRRFDWPNVAHEYLKLYSEFLQEKEF